MATIVTRSEKGLPLTNTEVDANFTNLNTELGTKLSAASLATVATSGAYSDLTGKPTNVSSFANDSGYITGITSGNVTTALGYTPANKAGDTFTGTVNVSNANVTVNAGYGLAFVGDQNRIITPDDNVYGALIKWGATGGCRFFESTTERMRIDGTGSVTANVDIRAPIFYDSNNTAFYINPNGVSQVSGANFNFGATGRIYDDGNLHIDGLNSPVWINSIGNNTIELNTQTSGYVNIGNSARAPIFYDSNNTGYYFDGAGTSVANIVSIIGGLAVSDNNNDPYGKVAVTRATGSNFTYYGLTRSGQMVYGMGIDTSNNYWIGGSTAGADGVRSGTPYLSLNTSGQITASGDFRAPIFYDSDNTSYYVDPASGSNLTGQVQINGGTTMSGGWNRALYLASQYPVIVMNSANVKYSGIGVDYTEAQSGMVFWVNGNSADLTNGSATAALRINTNNFVQAAGSFRAPIFYDIDDSNRYLDPSSTSVLTTVETYNGSGFRTFAAGSASISSQIYFANASNARAWNWQLDENNNAALWGYNGTAWAKRVGVTNDSELFLRNSSGSDVSLAYPSTFGYASSYKTMVLGNQSLTTVCIGVSPASNPSGSFNGGGLGLEVMFRNGVNFITPNSANNGYHFPFSLADGYAASSGSFRAPIFYDSNDTAYYVDPNSTSRLLSLTLTSELTVPTNSASYGGGVNFGGVGVGSFIRGTTGDGASATTSNLQLQSWFGIGFGPSISGQTVPVGENAVYIDTRLGDLTARRIITGASDVRAPIFYDSNDTGYYLDPNTTGLSLRVNGNIECYARSAAWSEGYRVRVPTRATWGGIRFTRDDANSNGNWAIGFTGIDSTDDLTFWGNLNGAEGMRARLTHAGNFSVAGTLAAAGAAVTYSYQGNGNVGGTGSASWHPSGIYSAGYNWLYGGISAGGGDITAVNAVYANVYYDSGNTAYYVDPASDTNLNKTFTYLGGRDINANWATGFQNTPPQAYNFHGDISSGGPAGTWWFYESMRHSNASNFWGTQIAWGWEDNSNRLQQRNVSGNSFSAWVEYLNTGGRTFSGGLEMTGIIQSATDLRAPIFYDRDNTAYYVDPKGNSRLDGEIWLPNYSNIRFGGTSFGAGVCTLEGVLSDGFYFYPTGNTHGLEFYMGGTFAQAYTAFRSPIFQDSANTAFYLDPNATGTSLNVAGSIVAAGNVTAYSDIRIKANVETIPSALDKLDQIRGVTYTRTDLDDKEQRYAGVIAQEIEAVLPEAVRDMGNIKAVDYNATIALLIQAVKELRDEVEMLRM